MFDFPIITLHVDLILQETMTKYVMKKFEISYMGILKHFLDMKVIQMKNRVVISVKEEIP